MNFQFVSALSGITLQIYEESFDHARFQIVMQPKLSRGITKSYTLFQVYLPYDEIAFFFTSIKSWMYGLSEKCDFYFGPMQICILPSQEDTITLSILIDDVLQITAEFLGFHVEGVCKVGGEYFTRKIMDKTPHQLPIMEYSTN